MAVPRCSTISSKSRVAGSAARTEKATPQVPSSISRQSSRLKFPRKVDTEIRVYPDSDEVIHGKEDDVIGKHLHRKRHAAAPAESGSTFRIADLEELDRLTASVIHDRQRGPGRAVNGQIDAVRREALSIGGTGAFRRTLARSGDRKKEFEPTGLGRKERDAPRVGDSETRQPTGVSFVGGVLAHQEPGATSKRDEILGVPKSTERCQPVSGLAVANRCDLGITGQQKCRNK